MATAAEINQLYYNRRKDRIGRLLQGRRDRRADRYAKQIAEQERRDAIEAEQRAFGQKLALGEQAFAFDQALQTDRYQQARLAAEQQAGFDQQARADSAALESMLLGERAGYDQQAAEFQALQEAEAEARQQAFEQEMFEAGVAADAEAASMQQRFDRESADAAFGHELQSLQAQTLAELDLAEQQEIQQGLRDGTLYYTPGQKQEIAKLDDAEGKVQSDPRLSPEQRLQALSQIQARRQAIRPLHRSVDEQPVPLAESLATKIHNFELYKDLPWTLSETGEPQLPRGFSMPSNDGTLQTPSGMSPKEQSDAAAKLMAEKREWFKYFAEQETTTGSGDNEVIKPKYTAEQAARMANLMIDPDARAAMGFPIEDTGTQQGVQTDLLSPPRAEPPGTAAVGDTSYLDRMRRWREGQQPGQPAVPAGSVEERHEEWLAEQEAAAKRETGIGVVPALQGAIPKQPKRAATKQTEPLEQDPGLRKIQLAKTPEARFKATAEYVVGQFYKTPEAQRGKDWARHVMDFAREHQELLDDKDVYEAVLKAQKILSNAN